LFKIKGGIQVAVDHQAAVTADVHTRTQIQSCLDVPTLRTALRGRVEPVGQENLTAIPLALVYHLTSEFIESHIRDRLCQMMIFHHPTHMQVFQHND
jgi:hypothetical protein